MSKTREFVEEIELHGLPEFGGFRTIPYEGFIQGVEVIKSMDGLTLRKVLTWDEIRNSRMPGDVLAQTILEEMNEEWDNYPFG